MLNPTNTNDWLDAQTEQRTISILSNQNLLNDVREKQQDRRDNGYTGPAKRGQLVNRFSPFVEDTLAPAELLHAVGRITTPIIGNLADLSTTWAMTRYLWAFSPNRDSLGLSRIAKNIDSHQKSILSDELGVGMAWWVMKNHFDAKQRIDVEVALDNPSIRQALNFDEVESVGKASPDYLFRLEDGSYAIVECKGTQSKRAYSMTQLRRGLEQVRSIEFPDSRAAEYVIATYLKRTETDVHILDPPGGEEDSEKSSSESKRKPLRIEDESSFERFERGVGLVDGASLLGYAGAEALAFDVAGFDERFTALPELREEPELTRPIDILDSSFRGQFVEPRSTDVRFFFGIHEGLYETLRSTEFRNSGRREVDLPDAYYEQFDAEPDTDVAEQIDDAGGRPPRNVTSFRIEEDQIASIDRDGTVFMIET
jgi:DNA gyrase inhibitor GyrI